VLHATTPAFRVIWQEFVRMKDNVSPSTVRASAYRLKVAGKKSNSSRVQLGQAYNAPHREEVRVFEASGGYGARKREK
jgi:hypothetical protein